MLYACTVFLSSGNIMKFWSFIFFICKVRIVAKSTIYFVDSNTCWVISNSISSFLLKCRSHIAIPEKKIMFLIMRDQESMTLFAGECPHVANRRDMSCYGPANRRLNWTFSKSLCSVAFSDRPKFPSPIIFW